MLCKNCPLSPVNTLYKNCGEGFFVTFDMRESDEIDWRELNYHIKVNNR